MSLRPAGPGMSCVPLGHLSFVTVFLLLLTKPEHDCWLHTMSKAGLFFQTPSDAHTLRRAQTVMLTEEQSRANRLWSLLIVIFHSRTHLLWVMHKEKISKVILMSTSLSVSVRQQEEHALAAVRCSPDVSEGQASLMRRPRWRTASAKVKRAWFRVNGRFCLWQHSFLLQKTQNYNFLSYSILITT